MAVTVCLSVTIRDEKQSLATLSICFPGATTLAAAETFANTWLVSLKALILGEIVSARVYADIAIPVAAQGGPEDGADVEEGGLFIFRDANGFQSRVRVPTFKETLIQGGSRLIETGDPDVTTFVNQVIAGLAGTNPSTSHGDDITALYSAKEQFVKSRS